MTELRYTVPGRPVSWQRKNVVKGRVLTDKAQRAAKTAIRYAALAAMLPPRICDGEGEYAVWITAYYPSRVMGDADRIPGLHLDALEGLVYKTDRQVSDLTVRRRVDATNPRTEVRVIRLEGA